jgi:transmembrane sensor
MSTSDSGDDIREQAARWVVRMTDAPDAQSATDREQFAAWVVEDPRHEREFRIQSAIAAMMSDMPEADRARWTTESTNRVPGPRAQSRRQVYWWTAIAASVVTAVVLGGFYARSNHLFNQSAYVTRAGQMRTITLQDNSVVHLNTRTELRWVGREQERRVELTEGEAFFDVVHDVKRPFSVMLDNSEIRVLGTRFNVYRKPSGDTTVTVLEGTVEVRGFGNGGAQTEWTRRVGANQQIQYRSIGLVREPYPTQAQDATRWRDGFYQFDDKPLGEVLEELARYTDQSIVIRNSGIAEMRAGGIVPTTDVRVALKMLEQVVRMPIEVKESNGTFTIDYRADATDRKD